MPDQEQERLSERERAELVGRERERLSEQERAELIEQERGASRQPTTSTAIVERERAESRLTPLLPEDETRSFQSRWSSIQTEFVDEPRGTLEKADQLVAEVMTRLADVFAQERADLEKQWEQGEQTSTEDLRLALQRYRSFFQRLLSIQLHTEDQAS